GVCLEALGKHEESLAALSEAVKHPPDRVASYELLARLLRRHLAKPREADAAIDAMVAALPEEAAAYLARVRYRIGFGGDAAARDAIAKDAAQALKLAPENADALLMAAQLARESGQLPEAVAHLEKGCKLHPGDSRMYRQLAWLELWNGKPDRAIACLEQGI